MTDSQELIWKYDDDTLSVLDQWRAFFHAIDFRNDSMWIFSVLVAFLVLTVVIWRTRSNGNAQIFWLIYVCK
jgi:hypothetical protein